MKCRACIVCTPLAVALVALAWAVSVPVRGAKAMFAATNNACAYKGSAFSGAKGDGLQCADGALAVVSTSHALSSPIIYKEYQGQYNAAFCVGGENIVAACSATPIIYKECQGQESAVFRTDSESVVATSSATPIIYKECQGQDRAVFRTDSESVVATSSATPIICKECQGQDDAAFRTDSESVEVVSSTTAMINEGSQIEGQSSIVGDEDSLVVPRSVPVLTPSKRVVNEEGMGNCAIAPTSSMRLTPYQAPWISAPQPDSTAMQWFLRTYKQNGKPRKAYVSVATTGKTQLLVNGMNVSRNLFEPHRAQGDTSVVNIVYDVTPFLSRNANTISLWYCPTMPHVGRRQVAVCYWGENADGTPFAFQSDENWACRRANRGLQPPESEWQDSSDKAVAWQINHADTISWQSSVRYAHPETLPPPTPSRLVRAPRVAKVYGPSYVDVRNDTLTCVFPHHFQGVVRITFRGTRTGEKVYIDGFRYICNGATDEQFFSKFIVKPTYKLIVHGDKYFRSEHVQNVEAMETSIGLYGKFLF